MAADERLTIDVDGKQREFLLHLPDRPTAGLPLVVMFHGTGGTAAWAADETGWSDYAEREGFAVVYPEGLPPNPAKPPKFLTNPPVWHDGSWGRLEESAQEADLRFISLMLDTLIDRFAIDDQRIFATGFSNGAGMTFLVAARMAERIRAIAPVAGHCWIEVPRPARRVPTLYMVGSEDPLIPLQGGTVRTPWGTTQNRPSVAASLRKWARAIDCDETPIRLRDENGQLLESYCSPVEESPFLSLTIHGLGHHWPGGKGKLSEKIGGPRLSTTRATEQIWNFFQTIDV